MSAPLSVLPLPPVTLLAGNAISSLRFCGASPELKIHLNAGLEQVEVAFRDTSTDVATYIVEPPLQVGMEVLVEA